MEIKRKAIRIPNYSLGEEIFNAIKECTDKSKAQINATEIFISKNLKNN
jgi:hypothetical protein